MNVLWEMRWRGGSERSQVKRIDRLIVGLELGNISNFYYLSLCITYEIIDNAYNEMIAQYPSYWKNFTDGFKNSTALSYDIATSDEIIVRYSLPSCLTILSVELYAVKLVIDNIAKLYSSSSPYNLQRLP